MCVDGDNVVNVNKNLKEGVDLNENEKSLLDRIQLEDSLDTGDQDEVNEDHSNEISESIELNDLELEIDSTQRSEVTEKDDIVDDVEESLAEVDGASRSAVGVPNSESLRPQQNGKFSLSLNSKNAAKANREPTAIKTDKESTATVKSTSRAASANTATSTSMSTVASSTGNPEKKQPIDWEEYK